MASAKFDQLADKLQRRPTRSALIFGAAVVVAVVLAVKSMKWKTRYQECALKRGFLTAGIGNFELGGENPVWELGSGDAGSGGSLARATTPAELSAYMPQFRRSVQLAEAHRAREQAAAQYDKAKKLSHALGKDNMLVGQAISAANPEYAGCGQAWEPAAAAEVEGLAAVQALTHPAEGVATLESVIHDAVDDTQEDSTKAQIARMYSQRFRDS